MNDTNPTLPLHRLSGWAALALLALGLAAAAQTNTLLIIADDVGVDAVNTYKEGASPPPTPNIDALAAVGVLFRNAYANPVCSATRAAYMTGRHGLRTGITSAKGTLPTSETILPEVLDRGKIAHALIGKWHLAPGGGGNATHPNLSGWSHFAGSVSGNLENGQTYFSWRKVVNGTATRVTNYATTENVDDALAWIKAQSGSWMLSLNFNAAHTPFHAPPSSLHTYDLVGKSTSLDAPLFYKAAVQAMDTEIGRLLKALGATTLARTNVIFLGDNGTPGQASEAPFSSQHAKGTVYEGGINVPLIVSGPIVKSPGREESALVSAVDLLPTIAALHGVDARAVVPSSVPLDGVSILPLLQQSGASTIREFVYAEYAEGTVQRAAVRGGRYKLIRNRKTDLLFDLDQDPFEKKDLLTGPLTEDEQYARDALAAERDRLSGRASYFPFGRSAGGATLQARSSDRPVLGEVLTSEIVSLGSTASGAYGVLGLSRTVWGATPLPLDLGPLGLTGSKLHVSVDVLLPLPVVQGAAVWSLPIPAVSSLLGLRFRQQGLVFDAKAGPLGVYLTNAAEGTIEAN